MSISNAPLQTEHYTFRIYRGASERVPFAYASVIDGVSTPIDLTGKNLEISFVAQGEVEPFMVLNTDGTSKIRVGGGLVDATGSTISTIVDAEWDFEVFLDANDTPLMPLGRGKWYMMLIDGYDRVLLWNDFLSVKELYG